MTSVDLPMPAVGRPSPRYGKVIDHTRCIGCHACTTACKSENEVPVSVSRTYVKSVDVGTWPQARRAFQVTRCNQCEDAPCVAACPTSAMYVRADGIVDFDKGSCIGCKACMAACPYDAIFINPEDHCAEKCNFCAHRLEVGLEPACVTVCPTGAILVGDLDDPQSAVARAVAREPVTVRRPEKNTRPKLFYQGASALTLDPLAARRPEGTYAWAEQATGPQVVHSGSTGRASSSAAALVSYDVAHRMPWDWRVSLYTATKSVAAGAYLVALALALAGVVAWDDSLWLWGAPLVSATFLAVTAGLLVADLEHPERFYYVLTRPQWRSWLVRGGVVLTGFAGVLGVHLLSALLGWEAVPRWLALAGAPLAVMTAVYTAYLFAQATARDLWQSPLLAPHLLVQAVLAGAAVLAPFVAEAGLVLAGAAAVHLLLVAGEVSTAHATAHARAAAHEMTSGRYRVFFAVGVAGVAAGLLSPWLGWWVAPLALIGLAAHEHAYVQAGQAVPLA